MDSKAMVPQQYFSGHAGVDSSSSVVELCEE